MTTDNSNWDAIAREGNKRDRLGQYARCQRAGCGEEDPSVLREIELEAPGQGTLAVTVCAECQARLQGRRAVEDHHAAARANSRCTVPVPANAHAILTNRQQDWPTSTLRNPDGSPLLQAAALRGWLDVLRLIVERTVGWVPGFLEWLDAALHARVAERWWETLGWEGGPA